MSKTMKFSLSLLFILPAMLFAGDPPNVIVVLADDIGSGDISHYRRMHSDNIVLETPNLDALAESGMTFTQAHSPAALCSPTRYGIMTGNHNYRAEHVGGVWGAYEPSDIKDTDLTLGRLMQKAGYHTAFFGKWNLGGDFYRLSAPGTIYRAPRTPPQLDIDLSVMLDGPQQKGFDYDFTYPVGIQDVPYVAFESGNLYPLAEDSEIIHITQAMMDKINVVLDKDEGLGDSNWDPHDMGPLLAGKAVDYIRRQANQDKPFFLYYCSQAVHLPHTPPDSINDIKIAGTTPSNHLDMVKELDQQIGMMVQELKEQGVYENTIFVFTSDNGGLPWSTNTSQSGHESSDIYRGGKNSKYEGGHRVPFIFSWPDSVQAGSQSNEAIIGLDIMRTLAAITDTDIEAHQAMDSYDLWPLIKGEEEATTHQFLMLQTGTGREGIFIQDGWKLVMKYEKTDANYLNPTPTDFFDLNTNVTEREAENYINSSEYAAKLDSMFTKYKSIRSSRIPTYNISNAEDTTVVIVDTTTRTVDVEIEDSRLKKKLENVEVSLNDEVRITNSEGFVSFSKVRVGQHGIGAKLEGYYDYGKSFKLTNDTLIKVELNPENHRIKVYIRDTITHYPLPGAELVKGTENYISDNDGKISLVLPHGPNEVGLSNEAFLSKIDTIWATDVPNFDLYMRKEFAQVGFLVQADNVNFEDALIKIASTEQYTSSAGICFFPEIPTLTETVYSISKDSEVYHSDTCSFYNDTTISLNLNLVNIQASEEQKIHISPNPVKDEFTLYFKESMDEEILFSLFDMSGRLILEKKYSTKGQKIIRDSFSEIRGDREIVNGMFVAKIYIGNEYVVVPVLVNTH